MSSPKLKVGDWVVSLKDVCPGAAKGSIHRIIKFDGDSSKEWTCLFASGFSGGWFCSRFRKATEWETILGKLGVKQL